MLAFGSRTSDLGLSFGLTGGIACGKTTVARFFQGLGAHIIDTDSLGHELIEPGQAAYLEIVEHFGKEVLDASGTVDRTKLGARVFADPQELHRLNSIVHPRVIARAHELEADQRRLDPRAVVILEAALIFEAGLNDAVRKVIVAWCRPEQQLARVMAKTGIPQEAAEQRIRAQMSGEEKRRRADYLIDCSGTLEKSRSQVEAVYPELQSIVQATLNK